MNTQTNAKRRAYRGKYPQRVRQVEGMRDHSRLVTLNDGSKHTVWARDTGGKELELGAELPQSVIDREREEATEYLDQVAAGVGVVTITRERLHEIADELGTCACGKPAQVGRLQSQGGNACFDCAEKPAAAGGAS